MAGVALDRLDQIGNQVLPLLELDIDVGERSVGVLAQADQAIVSPDGHHDEDHHQDQDQETDEHPRSSPTIWTR